MRKPHSLDAASGRVAMSRYDDMPEEKIEQLKRMLEDLDTIDEIDDDTRELIATRWPWLLEKVKPKKLS